MAEDGLEKVDTNEEKQADMATQSGEIAKQIEENNPAPSNPTDGLIESGRNENKPIAESVKKDGDDEILEKFSSSSESVKVIMEEANAIKFSSSSDNEKKDAGKIFSSLSGSEKLDKNLGRSSSTLKKVAFEESSEKVSEENEESQSEDRGSIKKRGTGRSLETQDSTTMTTIESEPEFSDFSSFSQSLRSHSTYAESKNSKENSAEMYSRQAHELVNMVIANASKHLLEEQMRRQNTMTELEVELSRGSTPIHTPLVYDNETIENIDWLTIEEFTIDRGTHKIEEFIKTTWFHQDNWLYCTDHLGKEEFDYDTRYRYRVRWSVPTRRKPIPRATASVYFTFSVSKVKPRDYPVDVYYVFETNRLVHRPGESRFREKWLKDIIESKVITMNGIHF